MLLCKFFIRQTTAVASWDSSVHEHPGLNKVTAANERIYFIVKVVVRLAFPSEMEVTLRKRCCVSVVKAPTFAERWLKKFVSSVRI